MKTKLLTFLAVFFLFLSSCGITQTPSPVPIFQPPTFSFVSIDANNTDENYIKRMEKYDSIMSKSLIPVYIMDINDFSKDFPIQAVSIEITTKDPNDPNSVEILDIKIVKYDVLGLFMYNKKKEGWPKNFIFINNSLTPRQIITTYSHELGHYEHKKKGCPCMSGLWPIAAEEHAFLNELEVGWEYNDPDILECAIRIMGTYVVEAGPNSIYKMAVFNVMNTPLFKKTMAHLIILEGKKN